MLSCAYCQAIQCLIHVWSAVAGSRRTALHIEATRCFARDEPLTLGFCSRSFSSLSGTLRPHVPSMCPPGLWSHARNAAQVTSTV